MPSIFKRGKLRSTHVKQPTISKNLGAVTNWNLRRYVKTGFPRLLPFQTIEEIKEYLNTPLITCLLCGKQFKWLSHKHLKNIHNITIKEYKDKYNLPYSVGLSCNTLKVHSFNNLKKYALPKLDRIKPQTNENYKTKTISSYMKIQAKENLSNSPSHKKNNATKT